MTAAAIPVRIRRAAGLRLPECTDELPCLLTLLNALRLFCLFQCPRVEWPRY